MNRSAMAPTLVTAVLLVTALGCADGPTEPTDDTTGDFLLITSIPNESGADGASFVQTVGLGQTDVTNADAFEQSFRPYPYVNGDDVILAQGTYGDEAVKYVRGSDGRLSEAGRMSLPSGGTGAGIVYASDTKAYLSLYYAGVIIIFNPQTMTITGEIDLTTLDLARNTPNPDDVNPEPALMAIRDGKLFVALHQLETGFASADGADIAVFDVATDTFEKVTTDSRTTTCGALGFNQTMFVDENNDLYVYCIASYGFVPGQEAGILRILDGETDFDPSYFLNLSTASVSVPGGQLGFMGLSAYDGNGNFYGVAEVPALASNPPNYAEDRNFQAVSINLPAMQVSVVPLPLGNGIGTGAAIKDGQVIYGLSTATGVGLYTYDPVTGDVSDGPVMNTAGDPTHLIAFQ